jgi:hypothetical protein
MSKCSSDAVYGMGLIGALFYNIQYADGFKEIVWGIGKSLLWPALLVYEVLSRF